MVVEVPRSVALGVVVTLLVFSSMGVLVERTPEFMPATIWEGRGGGVGLTTVGGAVDPPRIGRITTALSSA